MAKSCKSRGAESKRLVRESILIPATFKIVQFVVEARVVDMNLIRADTDEGA